MSSRNVFKSKFPHENMNTKEIMPYVEILRDTMMLKTLVERENIPQEAISLITDRFYRTLLPKENIPNTGEYGTLMLQARLGKTISHQHIPIIQNFQNGLESYISTLK